MLHQHLGKLTPLDLESEFREAVLPGDDVVRYAAKRQDNGTDNTGAVLAGGAVQEQGLGVWPGEVNQDRGEGDSTAGAEDLGVGTGEASGGELVAVVPEARGDDVW